MKSINREDFFRLVSANSGVDLDSTRDVFYGMIKTISRELRDHQSVKLPDWGEFNLKVFKKTKGYDINKGIQVSRTPVTVVKFTPDYKVKRYFSELGKMG